MAASILFFLLLCAFVTASAQQRQSNISLGSSLKPTKNSSWLSSSGLYAFGFHQQASGYAVGIYIAGIKQKTVVWTANRDDPPVSSNATLQLTSDGRLVLLSSDGRETDIANSGQSASYASMLDSGNFVLYGSNRNIIWQSFSDPTDTLLPGQPLLSGDELLSSVSETDHSTGIFRLAMQDDGNLVQYPVQSFPVTPANAYYNTGTFTRENVTLHLEDNGHLYLLNDTGINFYNLTNGGLSTEDTIYLARLDPGGIFRLYSHKLNEDDDWSVEWQSSEDNCVPQGLCGLNGFCVLIDREANCRCLPGFSFVQQDRWSAGCERNFVAESCKTKNGSNRYRIDPLENTVWEDAPYSVLTLSTRDDCEKACLEDCNCEAALLSNGKCSKQRLPLRYGRRSMSSSSITFVKVPTTTPSVFPDILPQERLPQRSKKEIRVDILIICISLVTFSFIILAISGVVVYRSRARSYRLIPINGNVGLVEDVAPRSFTHAELEKVTDGFKEEIGRGAFGTVFRGRIEGQKDVAVKRLEKFLADGEQEFQTEMKVIGRTHHRNLVRLLGYCLEGPHRLLVYEYMSNGSLADVLFTPERQPNWNERMEIARNIARGILYLHEECDTQIIHCDIKPQNILMNEHRCAKIADFGLAKLMKPDQTRTFTGIRGTRGYVAPEWHRKLPVTVKADVYSFGIVLLEIICRRKSVDWSLPEGDAVLEDWVFYCLDTGELGKLVGDEEVDKQQLERMVKVGLWCILDEPSLRPSMKKVVLMLEGTVDIPVPPSPTSFLSAI